jgi:hypothetical protein
MLSATRAAVRPLRRHDAKLSQMILDRKRDTALEAGRREDLAVMTGVCEPLHDRPQALRHTSCCVSDAVVIHEEKPHI